MPAGSRSIDVGWAKTIGLAGGRRTRTDPSRDVAPPACAVMRHSPAVGKTSRARNEPRLPVARTLTRPARRRSREPFPRTTEAAPRAGSSTRGPRRGRCPLAGQRDPDRPRRRRGAREHREDRAVRRNALHVHSDARGRSAVCRMESCRAERPSVSAAVAVAAGLWGMDALIRRPLAHRPSRRRSSSASTSSSSLVLLPVVVASPARGLARRAALRGRCESSIGAGSSALATILFTQAFVDGDPVTPVVLQKVQPLVAVSLAAVMLGGAAAAPLRPVPARGASPGRG